MQTDVLTRVNGLELAYRAHGVGPTLILLHAFPLTQRSWDAQVAGLSDVAHVVTLDLPGFGASQTTDGSLAIDALADLVADFASVLGHDRFVLGGLSMGGYVALAFARRHSERLQGLILADTRATADTPDVQAKRYEQIADIEQHGLTALAESFPHRAVSAATAIDQPELVTTLGHWIAEANPAGVCGALRMMATRPDATAVLPTIRKPTLVIVGGADALTPPAEVEAMATHLPDATCVRIPNAGHLPNLEAPEAFNSAVAAFLGRFR